MDTTGSDNRIERLAAVVLTAALLCNRRGDERHDYCRDHYPASHGNPVAVAFSHAASYTDTDSCTRIR